MSTASFTMDKAVMLTGGLLLEQAPKSMLLPDSQLENYYEPALQEFKDFAKVDYGIDFEPPGDFKQRVMDHIRYYLDGKRKRFSL